MFKKNWIAKARNFTSRYRKISEVKEMAFRDEEIRIAKLKNLVKHLAKTLGNYNRSGKLWGRPTKKEMIFNELETIEVLLSEGIVINSLVNVINEYIDGCGGYGEEITYSSFRHTLGCARAKKLRLVENPIYENGD